MWWRILPIGIILSIRLRRRCGRGRRSRWGCSAWSSLLGVISRRWVVLILKGSLRFWSRYWGILGTSRLARLLFSSGLPLRNWSIASKIILHSRCFCRGRSLINWWSLYFKIFALFKMVMMRRMESIKQLLMRYRLFSRSTRSLIKRRFFSLLRILSNIRTGSIVKEVYAHLRSCFWGWTRMFLKLWSTLHLLNWFLCLQILSLGSKLLR
jgi:hypothetical protein